MRSVLRVLFLLLFCCASVVHAQNITVKGTVTSADDGLGIIGAAVTVKGNTSIGTVTDFEGNFSLSVPTGSTIVISYVGYKTHEVKAAPGKTIKVSLETDAEMIDEVVVTGIQKMDKRPTRPSWTVSPMSAVPSRDVLRACRCKMCLVHSVQLLRYVSVVRRPSTATPPRCGSLTVSCLRMQLTSRPMTSRRVMPQR